MAGDNLRLHVEFVDECAEAEAEGLHPHQVDFFFQQPARVVLAKPGWLYQRRGFVGVGIRRECRFGRRKHQILEERREFNTSTQESRKALLMSPGQEFESLGLTVQAPYGRWRIRSA